MQLLALREPPTALFTGNNLLTIGALRAIHEAGMRIPEDIALAAFDEMDWMFFVKPAIHRGGAAHRRHRPDCGGVACAAHG